MLPGENFYHYDLLALLIWDFKSEELRGHGHAEAWQYLHNDLEDHHCGCEGQSERESPELDKLFQLLVDMCNKNYIYIYIYTYMCVCVCVCLCVYVVHSISFQTFFVQAFKIVVDSCKFTMLLLYILWDDWPVFMISRSNEQLRKELEYTLLKPDCHSWWISKMQSGRKDTLEGRYKIKFCFKLGKNATETYGMLQTAFGASCMNRASVFEWHVRFKESRESVRDLWEAWEE